MKNLVLILTRRPVNNHRSQTATCAILVDATRSIDCSKIAEIIGSKLEQFEIYYRYILIPRARSSLIADSISLPRVSILTSRYLSTDNRFDIKLLINTIEPISNFPTARTGRNKMFSSLFPNRFDLTSRPKPKRWPTTTSSLEHHFLLSAQVSLFLF